MKRQQNHINVKPNIGITKSTTTIKNRKQCSQIIQQMHAKNQKTTI